MTLSDLASIGSFISGFAVLISLVFLYYQLRQLGVQIQQAERNQQAHIRDSRATRIVDIYMGITDASLTDAISKCQRGDEDISETQVRQFLSYMVARLIHAEEAFNQYRDGLLTRAAFDQIGRGLRVHFATPGSRAMYSRLRTAFNDEFVEYLDTIVASTSPVFPDRLFSNFKSDVAAERMKASV